MDAAELRNLAATLYAQLAERDTERSAHAALVAELKVKQLKIDQLTYEMAIRDHYRLDVLARRAAELQETDAQLNETQRLIASSEAGVHGQCSSCGAVHSRGAAYCWQCGAPLLSEARPEALTAGTNGSNGAGSPNGAGSSNPAGSSNDANGVSSANDAFGVGGA